MQTLKLLAIPIALLVVAVSILYSTTLISDRLTEVSGGLEDVRVQVEHTWQGIGLIADQQARQAKAESEEARVVRVKNLAADCALYTAIAESDYDSSLAEIIDQSERLVWLALTGDKDPDAKIQFSDDDMVSAIVDRCYYAFYRDARFDDVRRYMRRR